MKRTVVIIAFGFLLGIIGYAALYTARTSSLSRDAQDSELAWLKLEFDLSDAEFARIEDLHNRYLPECARLCARIAAANADLEKLVSETNKVTPEIARKLAEIGEIRQECQTKMLSHFYSVSEAMPEVQGRRYLERMQKLTSLSNLRDHSVSRHEHHAH